MTYRITSFEELIEVLCSAKLIGNYTISDRLMGYVNRKKYPDYISKNEYIEYHIVTGAVNHIKQITVGKLSLIDKIVKKEEFIESFLHPSQRFDAKTSQ